VCLPDCFNDFARKLQAFLRTSPGHIGTRPHHGGGIAIITPGSSRCHHPRPIANRAAMNGHG
jgi:hypothetical protein